jgi:Family of unknown function (DUF6505)
MIKLLRTIRFDDSDERVFASAATGGEWAVSGAFAFAHLDPELIVGKTKQAFANGFLGLTTFGRSTFATVGEATDQVAADLELVLAEHFVAAYGAPDLAAARDAARAELTFVASLCVDVAINTVFTVRRVIDERGAIKEEFRTIKPPSGEPAHARVWTVERDDNDGA